MSESSVEMGTVNDLKPGRLVVIDGEPCKVASMDVSKTGKHGAHKASIAAISLFTGNKKMLMKPVDASIEIPIIQKKSAQITAVNGKMLQLMDLESYEQFEAECPDEFLAKAAPGAEIEIHEVMGKRLIIRIKGD